MNGFVDVESLVIAAAAVKWPGLRVGVRVPADLAGALPFLQIYRVGGPVIGIRTDRATMQVNYFAGTRPAANDGARTTVWWVTHGLQGTVVTLPDSTSGVVLTGECISGPSGVPDYGDPNAFRVGSTCSLVVQTTS